MEENEPKYPCCRDIAGLRKPRGPRPPGQEPRCDCGAIAEWRADVQVNWFRGDDVVKKLCSNCKREFRSKLSKIRRLPEEALTDDQRKLLDELRGTPAEGAKS